MALQNVTNNQTLGKFICESPLGDYLGRGLIIAYTCTCKMNTHVFFFIISAEELKSLAWENFIPPGSALVGHSPSFGMHQIKNYIQSLIA